MRGILFALFSPGWNRVTVIGCLLMGVGIVLTPFLIGIPIAGVGFAILAVSAMASFFSLFPGGKRLVIYVEQMFARMFSFLKSLVWFMWRG